MKTSTISIALATYNGERYLRQQIGSLLSQTIPFDELIICDDNSSDSTIAIINEYSAQDNRIKLFRNKINIGFKANFEQALSLCTGDIIALCDQDDIWLPEHIKTLYDNMENKLLVCGDSTLINKNGKLLKQRLSSIKLFKKRPYDCESIFRFIVYYQNPFQGASMMMQKQFLQVALPIPDSVKFHDAWFAHISCLINSFKYIPEPITLYRMHETNASGKHTKQKQLKVILKHFLQKELYNNRREIINALFEKKDQLSIAYPSLLDEARKYYCCRRTFKNRLKNLIFEFKNYTLIYN